MNYALTIDSTVITGVHESLSPFHPLTFENNPRLAGQEVRVIPERLEYQTGVDIRCYEPNGMMKPLVWCIEQGYLPLPPGKEIVEGLIIDKATPEPDLPPAIQQVLNDARAALSEQDAVISELLALLIAQGVIA